MNKVILTLALGLFMTATASAQFDFDKLYGGASIGYASPAGDFNDLADGGITYSFIAGYKLTERLSAGIQYDAAVTAAFDNTGQSGILGLEAYGLNNYFLRGQYKFLTGGFAPYAAVGLGLSSIEEPDITVTGANGMNVTTEGASNTGFGFDVELGIAIRNFILSYTYVAGGKSPDDTVFTESAGSVGVTYHRFQVGYIYNFRGE